MKGFSISPAFLSKLRSYLISVISILIIVLISMFGLKPQYEYYQKLVEMKITALSELSEGQKQYASLKSLEGLRDQLEEASKLAEEALPASQESIPYSLDEVIKISKLAKVNLETLNLGAVTEAKGADPAAVKISIGISGEYSAVLDFVKKIEWWLKIADVTSIQLSSSGKDLDNKASIALQVYFLPDPEIKDLTIEQIAEGPKLEGVLDSLKALTDYKNVSLEELEAPEEESGISPINVNGSAPISGSENVISPIAPNDNVSPL